MVVVVVEGVYEETASGTESMCARRNTIRSSRSLSVQHHVVFL